MEKVELPNKIKDDGEKHIENYRGFNILFSEEDGWHTNFVDLLVGFLIIIQVNLLKAPLMIV